MTIRPSKIYGVSVFILMLSLCGVDIGLFVQSEYRLGCFFCLFNFVYLLFLVRFVATMGKTITFHQDGCKISILDYYKEYSWCNLSVVRLEDYSRTISYKRTFNEGVFFSVKPINRPWWMGLGELCMLKRPFSAFFVTFDKEQKSKVDLAYPPPYSVDRVVFLNQLAQWDITPECKVSG